MEFSVDSIVTVVGLLLGGGGIGGLLTWRYNRRKEKAEAQTAEVNMAKEVQDIYQQALKSKDEEVADKNRIISELREERDHFRQDRNELRNRLDKTDETIRTLQKDVARNGRMVESMRPFMCADTACKSRQFVTISESGDLRKRPAKKNTIEPLENETL